MAKNTGIVYQNLSRPQKPLTIIALSGKIASGKSTLAEAICRADQRFVRMSLAGALKDDFCDKFGVTREQIEANKDRFRVGLQWYGTDLMRWLHGEDYWVDRLIQIIRAKGYTHVVVDDVRFPNELEGLRAQADNSFAVRLEVSEQLQNARCMEAFGDELSAEKKAHRSETALDDCPNFDFYHDCGTDWTPNEVAQMVLEIAGIGVLQTV